jgi:uncharacterized membrane protein YgcG
VSDSISSPMLVGGGQMSSLAAPPSLGRLATSATGGGSAGTPGTGTPNHRKMLLDLSQRTGGDSATGELFYDAGEIVGRAKDFFGAPGMGQQLSQLASELGLTTSTAAGGALGTGMGAAEGAMAAGDITAAEAAASAGELAGEMSSFATPLAAAAPLISGAVAGAMYLANEPSHKDEQQAIEGQYSAAVNGQQMQNSLYGGTLGPKAALAPFWAQLAQAWRGMQVDPNNPGSSYREMFGDATHPNEAFSRVNYWVPGVNPGVLQVTNWWGDLFNLSQKMGRLPSSPEEALQWLPVAPYEAQLEAWNAQAAINTQSQGWAGGSEGGGGDSGGGEGGGGGGGGGGGEGGM